MNKLDVEFAFSLLPLTQLIRSCVTTYRYRPKLWCKYMHWPDISSLVEVYLSI